MKASKNRSQNRFWSWWSNRWRIKKKFSKSHGNLRVRRFSFPPPNTMFLAPGKVVGLIIIDLPRSSKLHPGWVFFRQPSCRTHWLHNFSPSSPPTTLKPGGWNFRQRFATKIGGPKMLVSPSKKQKNSGLKWWKSLKVGKKKQRKAMVVFLRMIRLGWKIPDPNTTTIEPNCLIQTNFQGNPETYGRPLASLPEMVFTCISNLSNTLWIWTKLVKGFVTSQIPHGFGLPRTSGHSHALIAAP